MRNNLGGNKQSKGKSFFFLIFLYAYVSVVRYEYSLCLVTWLIRLETFMASLQKWKKWMNEEKYYDYYSANWRHASGNKFGFIIIIICVCVLPDNVVQEQQNFTDHFFVPCVVIVMLLWLYVFFFSQEDSLIIFFQSNYNFRFEGK